MIIEVTGVSVSKKGTVWIQAKQVDKDMRPKVGDQYLISTLIVKTQEEAPSEQEAKD